MTALPLALLAAAFAAAMEPAPAASTAPAPGRAAAAPANPWSLNYGYDRRGKRYGLDYRVRWDLEDLFESPRSVRENIERPSDTAQSIVYGLLKGARLDLYGVSVRPFRDLSAPAPPPALAASAAAAPGAAPPPPRRLKLALDPFADLRRNGPREIERFLLREGFDLALPAGRGAPNWQKEAAARGVLDAGKAWSEDLPER